MSEQIDAQKLANDLRSVKEIRRSPGYYGGYMLEALYYQAHEIINEYADGKTKISPDKARLFEEYIYEMTRSRHKIIDSYGFKAMVKLRDEHGISRPYIGSGGKLVKRKHSKSHKIFNKAKTWLLAGTIAAASLFGLKAFKMQQKTHENAPAAKVTLSIDSFSQNKDSCKVIPLNAVKQQTAVLPIEKTDTLSATQTAVQTAKTDSIWKNYYDSALKIHLGENKRNKLYQNVEALIKNKNITPDANFSIYRYAHSVTMWNLLKPYSAENKFIKEVMAGKKLTKEENMRFNSLIRQAGEKGKGLSAKGEHSNYDRSSKKIQSHHLKAVQTVNQYLKTHTR